MDQIDNNRKNITEIRSVTISQNIDLKRYVAREVKTGVRVPEVGETDPATYMEASQERLIGESQIKNTKALRERIRDSEFRDRVAQRMSKSWGDMKPDEREKASYAELQHEGMLPQPKRGWFSLWLSVIFDSHFTKMQQEPSDEFE